MIGLTEVIAAVSGMIEGVFNAPPATKDRVEGIPRPFTRLTPYDSTLERVGKLRHETYYLEIVRYGESSAKGWLQLLRDHKALVTALEGPIPVTEGFHVLADDIDFDVEREDMTLTATFAVELFQEAPEDDWRGGSDKKMDALDVNDEAWVRPEDD